MKYDVSLQTIAWFNGRRNDKTLQISPKFQRRPVWMEDERTELIATIHQRLPFPEIYIHHQTDPDDGSEQHVVVDGQQRITSIIMFIDGQISLPDRDPWNGRSFRDLSPDDRAAFWHYKVVVRSLSETNDAEIRELFARLNTNNIALNDQELRNARHKGRFKQAAERMADNPLFQSLALFTARDIRRMLDVEFASELLLINVEGVTNKKDLLDDAYANYEEEFPREAEYEEEFNASMALLRTLINDENKAQVKRKSNFFSLYGACLRYFRDTKRSSFRKPAEIGDELSRLFSAARDGKTDGLPDYFKSYYEAVSRAASDKGRRVERETILYKIVRALEDVDPTARTQRSKSD